jgi:HTH-type transcriptional regulator/antitoxin HipB
MPEKSSIKTQPVLPANVRTVTEIGNIVATTRKQQGLTQFDISSLSGLGIRFMVDLEKGKETIQMQKVLDVLHELGLEITIRKKGSR